jgi:hypothetical protein
MVVRCAPVSPSSSRTEGAGRHPLGCVERAGARGDAGPEARCRRHVALRRLLVRRLKSAVGVRPLAEPIGRQASYSFSSVAPGGKLNAAFGAGGERVQRRPLAVIEPGEGIWHEATEHRSGVAVATSRARDAGIVSKTEPGEASVQVISAVKDARHPSSLVGRSVGAVTDAPVPSAKAPVTGRRQARRRESGQRPLPARHEAVAADGGDVAGAGRDTHVREGSFCVRAAA